MSTIYCIASMQKHKRGKRKEKEKGRHNASPRFFAPIYKPIYQLINSCRDSISSNRCFPAQVELSLADVFLWSFHVHPRYMMPNNTNSTSLPCEINALLALFNRKRVWVCLFFLNIWIILHYFIISLEGIHLTFCTVNIASAKEYPQNN